MTIYIHINIYYGLKKHVKGRKTLVTYVTWVNFAKLWLTLMCGKTKIVLSHKCPLLVLDSGHI